MPAATTDREPAGRLLGGFETALTLSHEHAPFVIVVALRLEGGPSPDALRRALAALQRREPALRMRIEAQPAGTYRFAPAGAAEHPAPVPLRLAPRDDDGTWLSEVDAELNRRVDAATGPLLRAVYVLSPEAPGNAADGRGARELFLTFHHAVMDATCARRLVEELLRAACRDDAPAGGDTAAALAPPAEALFPAAFRGWRGGLRLAGFLARQVIDEVLYRLRTRGGRRPPVDLGTACHPLPVALSPQDTRALVRASRRGRVTMNAAVATALLLATWRRLYDGRPRPLRYVVFADLRPHLSPPVGDEVTAAYLTMLRFTTTVRDDSPAAFWELARYVARQTDAGLRRGDRYTALRTAAPMMRAVLRQGRERMAATATSYAGPVRLEPSYGGEGAHSARVRDLHVFAGNFGLGPELTAQARLFDGRLQLDFVYLDADLDAAGAAALADEVLALLRRAGAPEDAP